MKIDALLPLLLKGNANADIVKILSAIQSGEKSKALEALLPKDKNNEQLLSIMKMTEKKRPIAGLGAIESFASNEILGMFVKYYSCG